MLALRVGEFEDERGEDDDPTPAQREAVKRIVADGAEKMRHRLRLIDIGLGCVDPEETLETVRAIQRECSRILMRSSVVLVDGP